MTPLHCTSPSFPVIRNAARALLLLLGLALPAAQAADDASFEHRHALGGKVGSTGLGLEYSYNYGAFLKYGLRASVNFGTYSRDETRSGFLFDGEAKFNSVMLLADAHPYGNGFRLSAGLMVNLNKLAAAGRPVEATVEINDVTYPASAVERASGEVTFQWPSPYFGLGWGASPAGNRGIFYSFDFGVAYQRGDISLNVACGPTLPAAECAQLQSDVQAQEARFREDLVDYRLYPILTFGVGYRF
jgi:hypothetical protein